MKKKKKNELYKTTRRVKLQVPEVWLFVTERKTIYKSVMKGYQRKGILWKYLPELHWCFHSKLQESLQETLIYGELCQQQKVLENAAVDHYFDMRALTNQVFLQNYKSAMCRLQKFLQYYYTMLRELQYELA